MINIYGILISVSILTCILIVRSLEQNRKDAIWELSPWIIILGLIGARMYHIFSEFDYYLTYPFEIFNVKNGGLGIWGGLLGGVLAIIIFAKKHHDSPFHWLDICSVVTPIGQAIGRWGNYFNQEIYGAETDIPWGIYIGGKKHHPLFMYESVLNLINFLVLYLLYKRTNLKNKKGFFVSLYILNYSLIRFMMEFLRTDGWRVGQLNVSLLIPILLIMTALISLIKLNWRKA